VIRIIHIVWSPATGPIAAYVHPWMALAHARSMLGVEVTTVPVSTELPSLVVDDVSTEFAPAEEDTPVIEMEDIDDR